MHTLDAKDVHTTWYVMWFTDEDEKEMIIATIEESVSIIEDYVVDESESFTLVLDDCNFLDVRNANYFADLNPHKNQRATLEPELQHILEMYLPWYISSKNHT